MEIKQKKKFSHSSLTVKKLNIWSHYYNNKFGWFRILGVGLTFKDVTVHGLIFSERNGYKKRTQLGNWSIRLLKNKNDF